MCAAQPSQAYYRLRLFSLNHSPPRFNPLRQNLPLQARPRPCRPRPQHRRRRHTLPKRPRQSLSPIQVTQSHSRNRNPNRNANRNLLNPQPRPFGLRTPKAGSDPTPALAECLSSTSLAATPLSGCRAPATPSATCTVRWAPSAGTSILGCKLWVTVATTSSPPAAPRQCSTEIITAPASSIIDETAGV